MTMRNWLYAIVEVRANIAGSTYLDWVTDDFQNSVAAPLPSPLAADKKGSWQYSESLTIPGNRPSTGGSIFLVDETVEGAGDVTDITLVPDGVSPVSRLPGYGIYVMWNGTTNHSDFAFGFSDALSENDGVIVSNGYAQPGYIPISDTGWNEFAFVTLSKGFMVFRRSSDLISWYLEYVSRRGSLPSTNLTPYFACTNELGNRLEVGRLTCGQLGWPMSVESDIAHRSRTGVVNEAETLGMIPNMLITFDLTAMPTAGNQLEMSYRRLDANNRIYLRIDPDGTIRIGEVISGVEAEWAASPTNSISAGQAVTLKFIDGYHQVFVDDTRVIEYSDPNERLIDADDTLWEYNSAGGGEIQNVFLWRYMQPRQSRELLRTMSSKASTLGWDF